MIYSLSHIDLDGYGCQYILKKIYKNGIKFENSNYGEEILRKFRKILKKIDNSKNPNETNKIIITDLNLTDEMAEEIHNEIEKRENCSLLLLDHHITGEAVAAKYEWYLLNSEYCATYLTYLYFKEEIPSNMRTDLEQFAELVNVTDLWIESDPRINISNFLSNQIFQAFRFPVFLERTGHDYKMFMIDEIFALIKIEKTVREIEEQMFYIKEKFLEHKISPDMLKNKDESIDIKYYYLIYTIMKDFSFPTIKIGEAEGKLMFNLGSSVYQYVSNFYNTEVKDADFLMHVDTRGKISFRSKGNLPQNDVATIAQEHFFGGGHFNASGGSLENKDRAKYSKDEVLTFLKEKGYLIES